MLDPTFGSGGKASFGFRNNDDEARALAVQPDGKIVAVGSTSLLTQSNYDFAILRLNPNGTIDTSFNGTGQQTIAFDLGGSKNDRAFAVAIQTDGKIVVAGSAQTGVSNFVFAVARLNADGTIDTSFNGTGTKTYSFNVGVHNDQAAGLALQSDGKIVVAGYAQITATDYDFAVSRLNANGSLDATFNGTGLKTIAFNLGGGNDDEAGGVAVQTDNKIIVSGFAQTAANSFDFAIVRLNTDGSLDASFNSTGKQIVGFGLGGNNKDAARTVALQKDGKIVVAGYAERLAPNYDFAAIRLNADGSLDTSFNSTGKQTVAFDQGGNNDDEATALTIQSDGKILLLGFAQTTLTDFDFAVARLNADGSPDTSFNGNGRITIPFNLGGGNQDEAFGAVVQPDGKIVVAGFAQRSTTNFVFAFARVEGAPTRFYAIAGFPGRVRVFKPDGTLVADFAPYGASYRGGVSVAFGDVNGDGIMDLITGATIGNPHVKVFNGAALANGTFSTTNPDASLLAQWFPYALQFNVGANVAAGDISGNGFADVVTGATAGNPHVKVYSGKDITNRVFNPDGSSLLAQAFPYALQFNVGANVAIGDVNGDGYADIVTGATTGNPHVKVYSGKDIATGVFSTANADGSLLASFFAYGVQFNVGAFVTVGDANGDGYGDIITGASIGSPHVKVFDGRAVANHTFNSNTPDTNIINQFFAFDVGQNIGVSVGAANFSGTGKVDILIGAQNASNYRMVAGTSTGTKPPALRGIDTFAADIQGGIDVGA